MCKHRTFGGACRSRTDHQSFADSCLTAWLRRHINKVILANHYTYQRLARRSLHTDTVTHIRSNSLSSLAKVPYTSGAGNGNRTRNLTLARLRFTTKLYLQIKFGYRPAKETLSSLSNVSLFSISL